MYHGTSAMCQTKKSSSLGLAFIESLTLFTFVMIYLKVK
jgi:hypothetical protein